MEERASFLQGKDRMIISKNKECFRYTCQLDDVTPPKLHPSFVYDIESIDDASVSECTAFVEKYGQFYVRTMSFGYRQGSETEVTMSQTQDIESQVSSLEASVEILTFGASAGQKTGNTNQQAKSDLQSKTKMYSVGIQSQQEGGEISAAPIKYQLGYLENTPGLTQYQRRKISAVFQTLYGDRPWTWRKVVQPDGSIKVLYYSKNDYINVSVG